MVNRQGAGAYRKLFLVAVAALVIGAGILLTYLMWGAKTGPEGERIVSERITVEPPVKTEAEPEGAARVPEVKKEEPKARTSEIKPPPPAVEPGVAPTVARMVEKKPERVAAAPKKTPAYKPWAVHVASLETRNEAGELEDSLERKGYNAYVTQFKSEGVAWYRVRVGFYRTKDEAAKTAAKVSRQFKNHDAYPVMPARGEVGKYTR